MNSLRGILRGGGSSCGPFLKLADPGVMEIVGLAGFGHAVIDMEHGPLGVETAQNLVRAAELRGVAAMIRVHANEDAAILRALDLGAQGVHVPHIDSAAAAERALRACRFHPDGSRGVCRFVRAAEYTHVPKAEHFARSNDRVVPVLHIEGVAGIDALPAILDVDGHGVIFLGPYDLSQSCGVPGEVHHPDVVARMRRAVDLARSRRVAVGTFVDTVEDGRRWLELGVQYVCVSVDVGIFYDACVALVRGLQAQGFPERTKA
ncbi:MAG: aldolase [Lentisphaeria bacterium]|nr:aldolase [Lentisphaeria bacterium]